MFRKYFRIKNPVRVFSVVTLSLLLASQIVGTATINQSYAAKNIKNAGRTLATQINTLLSGKGTPSSSIGINGDFYIDTKSYNFYGPKVKGQWPIPISIRGTTGLTGPQGVDGREGGKGSSAVGLVGAQGKTGERGESGSQGAAGTIGQTGLTGATGSIGATGATGSPGSQGTNGATGSIGASGASGATGSQGSAGATGSIGASGAAGSQGATGLTGTTGSQGATGATGVSDVYVVTIPSFVLATASSKTSQTSAPFGVLIASKAYKFDFLVRGSTSTNVGIFGLTVACQSGLASLNYDYVVSKTEDIRSNIDVRGYEFKVTGTVVLGNINSTLTVTIIDSDGSSISAPMTVTGTAFIQLVGSVN